MQMIARYICKLQSVCWYVFITYDRINYSRHFPYNWATKKPIHLTKPAIYREFIKGPFSVKRSRGNYNKLPPDQVIEQMINIEQKRPGWIIGKVHWMEYFEGGCYQVISLLGLWPTSKKVSILHREIFFPSDLGKILIKTNYALLTQLLSQKS